MLLLCSTVCVGKTFKQVRVEGMDFAVMWNIVFCCIVLLKATGSTAGVRKARHPRGLPVGSGFEDGGGTSSNCHTTVYNRLDWCQHNATVKRGIFSKRKERSCRSIGILELNVSIPTNLLIERDTAGALPVNEMEANRISSLAEPVTFLGVHYSFTQVHSAEQETTQRMGVDITVTIDLAYDMSVRKYQNMLWPEGTKRSCVRIGPSAVDWTESGCDTLRSNAAMIVCRCQDATNVGVKVVVHEVKHQTAIFTTVGVAISISTTLLLATLFLLAKFRKPLNKPDRRLIVQLNMSTSLLLYHLCILYTLGIAWFYDHRADVVGYNSMCLSGGLIQLYFELTAVMWILVEGLVIFKKVCLTHLTMPLQRTVCVTLAAWIFPALVTLGIYGLSTLADSHSPLLYSEVYDILTAKQIAIKKRGECVASDPLKKYDICCFHPSNYTMILFGLVVGVVIFVTVAILLSVSVIVWKKSRIDCDIVPSKKGGKLKADLCQVSATIRAVGILTAMLGTPWLVCLLILNLEAVVAKLVFIFFQGPIVFFLYCVNNNEMRLALKRTCEKKHAIKRIGSRT